jgi:two-component system LytT family response regulator
VDDEPLALRGLRSLLRSEEDVAVVAECTDGEAALAAVASSGADVLFVDVQMPGLDGFEVVRAIPPEQRPLVVFVTAHAEFAHRAFDAHAVDYLLKPIDPDRLRESVARVRSARAARARPHVGPADGARPEPGRADDPRHFVVRVGARLAVVPHATVTRLVAEGNYVRVHAAAGAFVLRESLSRAAARLDPRAFLQVHRGAVVATAHIRELQSVRKGEYVVVLRDGTRVPSGPTYRSAIEAWLGSKC